MNKTASFFNDYSIDRAEEDIAGWLNVLPQTDQRHKSLVLGPTVTSII